MLAPWKKNYDQPRRHIKKQRHYFADKGPSSKTMVFPLVTWMWELDHKDSWVLKIDAFELWCWRRLLRAPWTTRRSNQSILKEISPEYSLNYWRWSWSFDTLTTRWKELTLWKRPWCCKRLKAGGEGDDRGWDGWMASPTRWTWIWASSRSWWWTGKPGVLLPMGLQRVRHDWATELNWRKR